ncbi:MAG: hypothetical protein ACQERZ_03115 [Fusobacteriota bacterium]
MDKKMKKLFKKAEKSEELAKRIFNCESSNDLKLTASEAGIEMTIKEIEESSKELVEELKNLNESDLNDYLDNPPSGLVGTTALSAVGAGGAVIGSGGAVIGSGNGVIASVIDKKLQEKVDPKIHTHIIKKLEKWYS